jgi:hypothetical protein
MKNAMAGAEFTALQDHSWGKGSQGNAVRESVRQGPHGLRDLSCDIEPVLRIWGALVLYLPMNSKSKMFNRRFASRAGKKEIVFGL